MIILLYIRTNLDDHRLINPHKKNKYLVNLANLANLQKEKSHPTIHCIYKAHTLIYTMNIT